MPATWQTSEASAAPPSESLSATPVESWAPSTQARRTPLFIPVRSTSIRGSATWSTFEEADGAALVHTANPDYTTSARELTDLRVVEEERFEQWGSVRLSFGVVEVTRQVVSSFGDVSRPEKFSERCRWTCQHDPCEPKRSGGSLDPETEGQSVSAMSYPEVCMLPNMRQLVCSP